MDAQGLLFVTVASLTTLSLIASLIWQWRYDTEHDWIERVARSLFVALQVTIWANVFAFIVLDSVFGVAFGGTK